MPDVDAFAKLRKPIISFVTFVCLSAWNSSSPTARIFMNFDMVTRITGTLREHLFMFVIVKLSRYWPGQVLGVPGG